MSNDEKYPTIERLADLTNTTVGYQKPDLEREAVLCWRELATLRERLAEAEALAEQNAKDAERLDWLESQHTLHGDVEIVYVVDGYDLTVRHDGNAVSTHHGNTFREAIDAARKP